MKNNIFPLNYFKSIGAPLRAFENRNVLNRFQLLVVFICLNLLMIIPVVMHYQKVEFFNISNFSPNAIQLIDEQAANALNKADYTNGEMILTEPFIIESDNGVLTGGLPINGTKETIAAENYILFDRFQFIINDETGTEETIPYSNNFSLEGLNSEEEIITELSRQYTVQNRYAIIFSFALIIFLFLLMGSAFIVLLYASSLYLFRDIFNFSIASYKESVNLILNLLALPTLFAVLFGLIRFNIIWMLGVQMIGLVSMLVILFRQLELFSD